MRYCLFKKRKARKKNLKIEWRDTFLSANSSTGIFTNQPLLPGRRIEVRKLPVPNNRVSGVTKRFGFVLCKKCKNKVIPACKRLLKILISSTFGEVAFWKFRSSLEIYASFADRPVFSRRSLVRGSSAGAAYYFPKSSSRQGFLVREGIKQKKLQRVCEAAISYHCPGSLSWRIGKTYLCWKHLSA